MAANAPEWRFGNGWTDEVLSARLAALVAATERASPGSSMSAWTDEALASLDRAEPGGRIRHLTSREVLAQEHDPVNSSRYQEQGKLTFPTPLHSTSENLHCKPADHHAGRPAGVQDI